MCSSVSADLNKMIRGWDYCHAFNVENKQVVFLGWINRLVWPACARFESKIPQSQASWD
jgi:hypothetical protein